MVNQLAARLDVTGSWLATGVDAIAAEPADLVEAEVALRLGELDTAESLYRRMPTRAIRRGRPRWPGSARSHSRAAAQKRRSSCSSRRSACETAAPSSIRVRSTRSVVRTCRSATSHPRSSSTNGRSTEAVEAEAVLEELRFSVVLANVLIDRGDFSRAEAVLARVIRITDESGDPIALARLYWSQSRLHSRREEPRLAGRYARRALEILERTENETFVALAYHLLATTEVEAGNGGEALRLLEYGREIRGGELGRCRRGALRRARGAGAACSPAGPRTGRAPPRACSGRSRRSAPATAG